MDKPSPPALRFGDRVRTITETWEAVPVGSIGTVVQGSPSLAVQFDHDLLGDGTGVWALCDHQVDYVAETHAGREELREEHARGMDLILHLTNSPFARVPKKQP